MSIYNEKYIKHGKTDKECRWCGKTIPSGSSRYTVSDMCHGGWNTVDLCEECYPEAEEACKGDSYELVELIAKREYSEE